MVKKNYSVTLEEEVVDKAQGLMGPEGRKLSPVINNLLIRWIELQEESMELEKEEEEDATDIRN